MRPANCHLVSSTPADDGRFLGNPTPSVPMVIASGTLSGSFTSPPFRLDHLSTFSVIAQVTGNNVSGTLSLNASNNATAGGELVPTATDYNSWIWVPIVGASNQMTSSVSAGNVGGFNYEDAGFKWVQVQWTHLFGTGSIDVWVNGKGAT